MIAYSDTNDSSDPRNNLNKKIFDFLRMKSDYSIIKPNT